MNEMNMIISPEYDTRSKESEQKRLVKYNSLMKEYTVRNKVNSEKDEEAEVK